MKHVLITGCLLVFKLFVTAQKIDKVTLDTQLDSIFKSISEKSPGVAVTVLVNGEPIARKAYGMANLEHKVPFTHNSPLRLGYSGGREFMCVGLAIMEADGLLGLDDKVKKYFTNLPAWSANITIQDLLNHSSGFDDEWATMLLMQADMDNRVDKEQLLTLLYNQPKPQVEPGKGYMYSNSDFALLRYIMEIASKKKLPDYLDQKLFKPLGMTATFMNDNLEQIIPGLADKYFGGERYFKEVGVKTSPGGNYRMVTSASDLEKWGLALEDSFSIPSKAIQRLHKNARPIPVLKPRLHYVFGHEWIEVENSNVIKHGGVNNDFYMTRIPSKKITIIGLGNLYSNMTAAMNLADIILNKKGVDRKPAPPVSANPYILNKADMTKYAGRYFEQIEVGHSSHLPNIRFYDIKLERDSLQFHFAANDYFTMRPVGENLFKDPDYDAILQFLPTSNKGMKMQVWSPGGDLLTFVKTNNETRHSRAYLQSFVGEYHSKHLDFYSRVILNENNELVLRRPTISDKILVPDGENRFLFEMEGGNDSWYVVAIFTKDAKGEVNGIDMQHVRMMHHRFDKVK